MKHLAKPRIVWPVTALIIVATLLMFVCYPPSNTLVGRASGGGEALANQSKGSTLTTRSVLYGDGRRVSGEQIELYGIASWEKFLYVSSLEADGDFWLDAWDLNDPSNPRFLEGYPFGNIFDDQHRLIPAANLKGPRDLIAREGRLLIWSSLELLNAAIQPDGRLGERRKYNLGDALNPNLNRISHAGEFASARRRLLSDQEFNRLIGTIPQRELEGLLEGEVLIDLQNLERPFIVNRKRQHGLNYEVLAGPLNGSYKGLPASIVVSDDKQTANVSVMSVARKSHFDKFWSGKSELIFSERNRDKSFNLIIDELIDASFVRSQIRHYLKQLVRKLNIRPASRLARFVGARFPGELLLSDMLKELGLNPDDSVKLALQKAVEAQISSAIERELSDELAKTLSGKLSGALLVNPALALSELRTNLNSAFNLELSGEALIPYLIFKVFSPLIDNPGYLNLTLGQLIELITNNQLAAVIDGFLGFFHATIGPIEDVLDAVDFEPPVCFQIPNSSRTLLNLMLVQSGPKLNPNGLAFIEMLKLAQFYFGNPNFGQFESDLRTLLEDMHADLASAISAKLSPLLDLPEFDGLSLEAIWGRSLATFSVRSLLARVLVEGLTRRIENLGFDPDLSLNDFLLQFGLFIDPNRLPFDASLATVNDFQEIIRRRLRLGRVALNSLIYRSGRLGTDIFKTGLRQSLNKLLAEVFGALSLDTSLEEGIQRFFIERIPGDFVANFSAEVIDRILESLNDGIAFPGIIGTIQLAAQEECIAQWQFALDLAEAAAAGSILFSGTAPVIDSLEKALGQAAHHVVLYITKSMLYQFLDQIFGQRNQDYRSFQLANVIEQHQLNLFELAGRRARHVDAAISKNIFAGVLRDMGASFPSDTGNDQLSLLTLDVLNPGAKRVVDLGSWETLNTVENNGGHILLIGQAKAGGGNRPTVLITDFTDPSTPVFSLSGDAAINFSASSHFNSINAGEFFAVGTQFGVYVLAKQRSP